eukprot:1491376-Rhodomonas_salina.2
MSCDGRVERASRCHLTLSERQAISLARAMLADPDVLLLHKPLDNVEPHKRQPLGPRPQTLQPAPHTPHPDVLVLHKPLGSVAPCRRHLSSAVAICGVALDDDDEDEGEQDVWELLQQFVAERGVDGCPYPPSYALPGTDIRYNAAILRTCRYHAPALPTRCPVLTCAKTLPCYAVPTRCPATPLRAYALPTLPLCCYAPAPHTPCRAIHACTHSANVRCGTMLLPACCSSSEGFRPRRRGHGRAR